MNTATCALCSEQVEEVIVVRDTGDHRTAWRHIPNPDTGYDQEQDHPAYVREEDDEEPTLATPPNTCPRCGHGIPTDLARGEYAGALSRWDNQTEVCSQCGQAEALLAWTGRCPNGGEGAIRLHPVKGFRPWEYMPNHPQHQWPATRA